MRVSETYTTSIFHQNITGTKKIIAKIITAKKHFLILASNKITREINIILLIVFKRPITVLTLKWTQCKKVFLIKKLFFFNHRCKWKKKSLAKFFQTRIKTVVNKFIILCQ